MPLLSKNRHADAKTTMNKTIIDNAKGIETSLTPNIPSLKVLTTYSTGFAIDIFLQISGRILIE
jgi:hypothetical protein